MCFSVKIERNFNRLSETTGFPIDTDYLAKVSAASRSSPKIYKLPDDQDRIYPGHFAPVIVKTPKGSIITAMRYRLTPSFSDEMDYKSTNIKTGRKKILPTYNARKDSLRSRKAWEHIWETNHALVPVRAFYEFVDRGGKAQQVEFKDKDHDIIWASALWDKWEGAGIEFPLYSFAIVTTEPPHEVSGAGHDRCPIFHSEVDSWDNFFDEDQFKFKVAQIS